jgi:DnaJ-class molecular chaperone
MDPYSVLGLHRGASDDEVKNTFRTLAKTCHPDLHPDDPYAEKRFKEINAAYDAIRNPQPEPIYHSTGFHDFSPFEDIFANLRGFTRQQQRNPDIHLECRLTLEDVFHGKELDIAIPSPNNPRTVKVRIPAGVEDGMSLRMAQAGNHTHKTLRPGDLYLIIRVLPHASLTRIGRNLTTVMPVSAFDVLLGKEIEVVGIDGKTMRIAIPASFDTSRKLRLAGQGMQDAAGRGDLLIELFIVFNELSDAQRALIQQAAEHMS